MTIKTKSLIKPQGSKDNTTIEKSTNESQIQDG